jgi:two-component system, chemotaxis family, chemotaxis protein CheY
MGMDKKTILVVEDHRDCRELLAIVLARSGYAVVKAGSALEAIDQAAATHPDLIIMDFGLPGMTGDQVILRLRAHLSTEKIPVIFTTGYMDVNVAERAKAVGAAQIMIKPFDLDKLVDTVERYLSSEPDRDAVSPEPEIVVHRLTAH